MSGFGRKYEYSGETTEWEDILIKKGIATKEGALISRGLNPEDFIKETEVDEELVTESDLLAVATLEELDEIEEDGDFDDVSTLNHYREKRLRELKELAVKNRFGDVREICKAEWVREVTESSHSSWVVVHLFHDSVLECRIMTEVLSVLSAKFKAVKFLKIVSTQAVENWPDRNLPTVFCYNEGVLKHQIMTLSKLGGQSVSPNDVEWWLAENGVVDTELEENPRLSSKKSIHHIAGRSRLQIDESDEDIDSDN